MARIVKCQITHEIGNTDTFIKIDGKYYKSQEIYDNHKRNTDIYKKIIYIISSDFLGYQKGQSFPTVLAKKLKELEFYPNEVILKTVENNYDNILYWMKNKEFSNDIGKISYIFAIIKNNINDVYRDWKRNQKIKVKENNTNIELSLDIQDINTTQKGKDISAWLEEEDI